MEFNFGAVEKINLSQVETRQKEGKMGNYYLIFLFYLRKLYRKLFSAMLYLCVCVCVCIYIFLNVSVLLVSTNNFNKRYLYFWRGFRILLHNIFPSFLHVIKQWSKKTQIPGRKKISSCRCRRLPFLYPHQLFD